MSKHTETQKTQVGNTVNCDLFDEPTGESRSRNWFFTLNNYKLEEIDDFKIGNYVFQEETGENGTPHLQGSLFFDNAKTFSQMKKINGRCKWMVCGNKNRCIRYCSKEETRSGQGWSNIKGVKFSTKKEKIKIFSADRLLELKKVIQEELLADYYKKLKEIDERMILTRWIDEMRSVSEDMTEKYLCDDCIGDMVCENDE